MILYQCTSVNPQLLEHVSADDALMFRQDGVYLLLTERGWPTLRLYASEQDMADRMLKCPASVQLITDTQWVSLCVEAQQVLLC
jgi:sulfur relay protein TusB/DsrH